MTPTVARRLPIGAELVEGGVHVRVWAPAWRHVTVVFESPAREAPLVAEPGGHHAALVDGIAAGARYQFRLGDRLYPDPASRYQPDGPFGPSQVIDPAFAWTDHDWPGIVRPAEQVLYELHVGTFTPEGTWTAAASSLPFLRDVGITTIEMMPVNEFAGTRGWGYDGVHLFSPFRRYGAPHELRAFVDRAHALGLGVILDVVYNHFGPAGNWHHVYAPELRRDARNEWGDMLDFACPGAREHFLSNARYWIDEMHFDGLRIDATQAILDDSDPHILREITEATRAAAGRRQVFIVGENEPQDTRVIAPVAAGGYGLDAVWNDDFHHTARVALTAVTDGYFHDYGGTPQELVSALEHGFLYQGQLYAWQRNPRGTPTRGMARARFVHFLENHDQVANDGFGERLVTQTAPAPLRAMTAVLLLGPAIPMLFQGQETGSRRPFRYFVDHDAELNRLVRAGRAEFLAQFARLATPEIQVLLPDPAEPATFDDCVLDPAERTLDHPHVRLHRDLLRIRREHPCFTAAAADAFRGAVLGANTFCVRWWHEAGDRLLLVNLGTTYRERVLPNPLLAAPRDSGWTVAWSSEHPDYGGRGTPEPFTRARLAIPARAAVLLAPDPAANLRATEQPLGGDKDPLEP